MAQIAYTENRPSCQSCGTISFGVFVANFHDKEAKQDWEEIVFLCAECGFLYAWRSKKLKSLRLEAIFKLPPEKAPHPHREIPEEKDFVRSHYHANFLIDGDHFVGDLGTHSTEWAALERARQISHLTAKGLNLKNHWSIQTGITREATNGKEG